ncbi:hypothetical protein BDZ91DRAFT_653493 [Kalaharituber pfeilii]|nr:hypothetical protein BDZ91DRAFT_653493 [Kalaharituber pfeilii]
MSNRNSTPDQTASSLRPPTSRPLGSGHHLRASADMSVFPSPLGSGRNRPSSEIFLNPPAINQNPETEALDKAAQKWLADLEVYERTLEEMAAATLDQDFKDELSAIEQWFRVLSEAERTAALYALLQQTTQVQIRFFITVLQQMARSHPMSAILSPANFDKDAMSNRMNEAMAQMSINNNRNSFNQVPPSPTTNRNPSGLDASSIHAMFPDAAAALAAQRAKITGAGGSGTKSNRNSGIFESRPSSNLAPSISTPAATKDNPPPSPWTQGPRNGEAGSDQNSRPKSAADMGQWQAPPLSAGLRSPRPQITGNTNLQSTTITAPTNNGGIEMPQLSPFDGPSGNWASMVNTPVVPMFNQAAPNAEMIANATAMKLAALSTVNNRIILDSDVGKFRRRPKNEQQNPASSQHVPRQATSMASPSNIVMYNEHGQPVQIPAAAAAAAVVAHQNQNISPFGRRSPRPNSPGIAFHNSPQLGLGSFGSPQNNGFLAAYDTSSPLLTGGAFGLGQFGGIAATEGYLSDEPSTARGRSPRSRRGTSKPPEDPTDPALLADISQWLRSLRLHKYTENLKDLKWQELIKLTDEELEKRGVNALGARRKMLKVHLPRF